MMLHTPPPPSKHEQAAKEVYLLAKKVAYKHNHPFLITHKNVVIPSRCPLLPTIRLTRAGGRVSNRPRLILLMPELGWTPSNVLVVSERAAKILRLFSLKEVATVAKQFQTRVDKQLRKHEQRIMRPLDEPSGH
ncbi:MAG: hypothetical protein U0223_16855 [Nitrospira sp.]|nr:hypothetical protein [Nitrospira sp.]